MVGKCSFVTRPDAVKDEYEFVDEEPASPVLRVGIKNKRRRDDDSEDNDSETDETDDSNSVVAPNKVPRLPSQDPERRIRTEQGMSTFEQLPLAKHADGPSPLRSPRKRRTVAEEEEKKESSEKEEMVEKDNAGEGDNAGGEEQELSDIENNQNQPPTIIQVPSALRGQNQPASGKNTIEPSSSDDRKMPAGETRKVVQKGMDIEDDKNQEGIDRQIQAKRPEASLDKEPINNPTSTPQKKPAPSMMVSPSPQKGQIKKPEGDSKIFFPPSTSELLMAADAFIAAMPANINENASIVLSTVPKESTADDAKNTATKEPTVESPSSVPDSPNAESPVEREQSKEKVAGSDDSMMDETMATTAKENETTTKDSEDIEMTASPSSPTAPRQASNNDPVVSPSRCSPRRSSPRHQKKNNQVPRQNASISSPGCAALIDDKIWSVKIIADEERTDNHKHSTQSQVVSSPVREQVSTPARSREATNLVTPEPIGAASSGCPACRLDPTIRNSFEDMANWMLGVDKDMLNNTFIKYCGDDGSNDNNQSNPEPTTAETNAALASKVLCGNCVSHWEENAQLFCGCREKVLVGPLNTEIFPVPIFKMGGVNPELMDNFINLKRKLTTTKARMKDFGRIPATNGRGKFQYMVGDKSASEKRWKWEDCKLLENSPAERDAIRNFALDFVATQLPLGRNGYRIDPGFVMTQLAMVQGPHRDYHGYGDLFTHQRGEDEKMPNPPDRTALDKPETRFLPYILHCPLVKEGMELNYWPEGRKSEPPIRVYIPFGSFLVLRVDAVHGGIFGRRGNLRLHIAFTPKESAIKEKGEEWARQGEYLPAAVIKYHADLGAPEMGESQRRLDLLYDDIIDYCDPEDEDDCDTSYPITYSEPGYLDRVRSRGNHPETEIFDNVNL